MVQCTAKDLIGKYVGSTEDIVREKLNEARGGVLLIDEVRMNTQFWMAYGCSVMFFIAGLQFVWSLRKRCPGTIKPHFVVT